MFTDDFERRLSAVHWGSVERTSSISIQETLLELLRAEPSQHERWCDRLEMCLLPQANLTDATPLAIPFLRELLERQVALGCIYRTLAYITICTEDFRPEDCLAAECRNQVRAGLDIYLQDAGRQELPIDQRSDAIDVICRLTEDRATWEPVLRQILNTDPNPVLRSELLMWLNEG